TGDITISGTARTLTLGDLQGSAITLGTGDVASIRMGSATDVSIDSDSHIRTLVATSWTDSDSLPDTIVAASLGALTIRGDFQGDLTLTDAQASAMRASVAGS